MGMGIVLGEAAKNWSDNEKAQFKVVLDKTSVIKQLLLMKQWGDYPHMFAFVEDNEKMIKKVTKK